ncbi:hypothetical protein Hanom_Chr09g00856961 [Helianthus anomalus]
MYGKLWKKHWARMGFKNLLAIFLKIEVFRRKEGRKEGMKVKEEYEYVQNLLVI